MTKVKFPPPSQWLTLELCESLFNRLDTLFDKLNREPLPSFRSRYPHRLESILGSAKLTSDLRDFDIADVASYYLVFISRGHPLVEGNKRAAVAFCLGYLFFEGFLVNITPQGLYEGTVIIAQSTFPEEDLRVLVADTFREKLIEANI